MRSGSGEVRPLPWAGAEGKPCHLLTDGADPLSRVADGIEHVQLGTAADLPAGRRGTVDRLRYLLGCVHETLTDARRIAEGRGARGGAAERW